MQEMISIATQILNPNKSIPRAVSHQDILDSEYLSKYVDLLMCHRAYAEALEDALGSALGAHSKVHHCN